MTAAETAQDLSGRVLIIDDERDLCAGVARLLGGAGYAARWSQDLAGGVDACRATRPDCVLLDLHLGDGFGLDALPELRGPECETSVIVVSGCGEPGTVVQAMRLGADGYLLKPLESRDLIDTVASGVRAARLRRATRQHAACADRRATLAILGTSPSMREVAHLADAVAPTSATVLLTGESGTGKEVLARLIHELSPRRPHPFVAVDCAAIPETLFEGEMFGHERGAYTGAHAAQAGKVEQAHQGTLFLDEVGEIPLSAQAKLLRFLETRKVVRLGARGAAPLDVRLIAATNVPLSRRAEQGAFRLDLYHRLAGFSIELPALRERKEDIPALAATLLAEVAAEVDRPAPRVAPSALDALAAFGWPGNVRELKNTLRRLVILCDGEIRLGDLSTTVRGFTPPGGVHRIPITVPRGLKLSDAVERCTSQVEREVIGWALSENGGHRGKAAALLGIDPKTLYLKLRALGLEPTTREG